MEEFSLQVVGKTEVENDGEGIKTRQLVQEVQKLNDRCLTQKKEKAEGRKIINII